MGAQHHLVISLLLLYTAVANAQSDSDSGQNRFAFQKTISFSAFAGFNIYPAGKFTLNKGPYNIESFRTSVGNFGISFQHSISPKFDLIYQIEGSETPIAHILNLKKNYTDSIYIPYDFKLRIISLSLWQMSFGMGTCVKSTISKKAQNSLAAILSVSFGYGSVGSRHSEPPPPEQVGSKRDTTLYLRMYQTGASPFIRVQDEISVSAGKFKLGIMGSISFFVKPQVRGEFIFLKNLANESTGTFRSSLINYSICGVMGYSIHRKNKVYSTDDFD